MTSKLFPSPTAPDPLRRLKSTGITFKYQASILTSINYQQSASIITSIKYFCGSSFLSYVEDGTRTHAESPGPICLPQCLCLGRPRSRMRWLNQPGRESWDWAEQKSLYKKNSPHKVGEETFVRMGAQRRQESAASPPCDY